MFKAKNFIAAAISFFLLFEGGTFGGKQEQKIDFSKRYTYEHVIIIGVDGAGNFHKDCNTPNMDKIFIENGAWTDYCRAATPSISAQCWGSMLTGVKPYQHKLTNDTVSHTPYSNPNYPTIFKMMREAYPDAEIGSFSNWNPINTGIVEKNLDVTFDTGVDNELIGRICTYIEDKKPNLFFIQFDSVDHEGHSEKYGSEAYLKQIETVDGYVGEIYESIQKAGIEKNTLLIITADHGGYEYSHGGATDGEMNTFFGAHGVSVNKTGDLQLFGRDLAAIVSYALNFPGNEENWDSFIPQNLFLDNMTPAVRPADEIAEHESAKTPEMGTEAGIENYIDMDSLMTGLFFDDGLADIKNGVEAETVGTVYYPEGYYGNALRVSSEGYLSLKNIDFGDDNNDITISFWLRLDDGITGDPVIFSNKDWSNGDNDGFAFIYNGASKFNISKRKTEKNYYRHDYDYSEPADFTRWNYITVVIDRYSHKVTYYSNFEEISSDWYKKGVTEGAFNTGMPLNFGQDGTGRYEVAISGEIDDLLIFSKVLEPEEIAKLKEYYVK